MKKANIDDDNNESEIEREAERIKRKEKKIEKKRLAKEKEKNKIKNEKEQNSIYNKETNFYKYRNNKKNTIDDSNNSNKKEEMKKRKQLEEELRAEINDYNKEDTSTFNNSSRTNINTNTQTSQFENEDKYKYKKKEYNKQAYIRNALNMNKTIMDEGAAPNEIIINDIPKSNLDRSFDTGNTYMKRKIPNRRTTFNIYKSKKPDLKGRSQEKLINELIENNSNSFNI